MMTFPSDAMDTQPESVLCRVVKALQNRRATTAETAVPARQLAAHINTSTSRIFDIVRRRPKWIAKCGSPSERYIYLVATPPDSVLANSNRRARREAKRQEVQIEEVVPVDLSTITRPLPGVWYAL